MHRVALILVARAVPHLPVLRHVLGKLLISYVRRVWLAHRFFVDLQVASAHISVAPSGGPAAYVSIEQASLADAVTA